MNTYTTDVVKVLQTTVKLKLSWGLLRNKKQWGNIQQGPKHFTQVSRNLNNETTEIYT